MIPDKGDAGEIRPHEGPPADRVARRALLFKGCHAGRDHRVHRDRFAPVGHGPDAGSGHKGGGCQQKS